MSASLQRKITEARDRMRTGDVAGAQALCMELLARVPRNPDVLCLLGITELAGGRPQEAIPRLELALSAAPRHGMALEHLGLAHLMLGTWDAAERALRSASALPGAPPSVAMRLGIALLNLNRHAEAIRELNRALEHDPQNPDIQLNLGQAHHKAGDVANARRCFEHILEVVPGHADALFNLGVLSLEQSALNDARLWFERTLSYAPQHADALVNLGIVHEQQDRPRDALDCFQRAVDSQLSHAQARDNLARLLALEGNFERAREHFLAALQLDPDLIGTRHALAAACQALGRYPEAVSHLREVTRVQPDNIDALSLLGWTLYEIGESDESMRIAKRVIALDSMRVDAYSVLDLIHCARDELKSSVSVLETAWQRTRHAGMLLQLALRLRYLCDWEKWRSVWQILQPLTEQGAAFGGPFALLCQPTSPAAQLAGAHAWTSHSLGNLAGVREKQRPPILKHARLRIGYFSSDLRDHAVAHLLAEVLELHDRARFEIFAYSHGFNDNSPLRARLQAACEHFVDIADFPDDIAVSRIYADELDLLVDLNGHTAGHRLAVLARRPCPLQISWIGYPGTMGAPFIQYLLADSNTIPEDMEHAYSERILRMPHCYLPVDRKRVIGPVKSRLEYGLPVDAFVFCSFTQAYKVSPEIFACWMRLLGTIPDSVLWLAEFSQGAMENLRLAATAAGIDSKRIVWAPRLPDFSNHLARYSVADLALDTFTYGSHSTAIDALWSGCPIIGLCGDTFAARASSSILAACNMGELITRNIEEYEKLALRIAGDNAYLATLRSRLAEARSAAPLFDTVTYTRQLEDIFSHTIAHHTND